MTDKAIISQYTWRSEEMQLVAFSGMQLYYLPQDVGDLFRPTSRKETSGLHCLSLGCIAEKEIDFIEFLKQVIQRRAILHAKEEGLSFAWDDGKRAVKDLIAAWRAARKNGIQVIGGRISAQKREKESKEACEKIRDRWPLPRKTWRTPVLLKEVGLSYNTARKFLGPRPIAQYNYQAKLKRAERKNHAKQ